MPIEFQTLGRGPHDRPTLLRAWGIDFNADRDEDKRCLFWDDRRIAMFLTQNNRGTPHSDDYWLNIPTPTFDTVRAQVNKRATAHNEVLRSSADARELGIFYRVDTGQPFAFKGIYKYVSERNEPDLGGLFFKLDRERHP